MQVTFVYHIVSVKYGSSLPSTDGHDNPFERAVRFDFQIDAAFAEHTGHRADLKNFYSYQPKAKFDSDAIAERVAEAIQSSFPLRPFPMGPSIAACSCFAALEYE